ncbi:MAG TPA: SIMPL domain-containing protein [Candidatus Dormibacteraeota bacterium]|nr:SIMPL domain-containing protein [Candidatus Dormibacteraeota bacterium]
MTPGTVVVRGHGLIPGEPDQLEVALTVSAVEDSAASALTVAARLSGELVSVLSELAVPDAARSTSGLSVREEFERIEGRWARRGYRASNQVPVRLQEPDRIGRLMSEAVARARARVDGPRWRFKPDNPALAEACRQAAVDARRKAEAYAGALGLRLGDVLKVAEPGTDQDPEAGLAPALLRDAPGPTEMQVRAGHLDVEATVEVTFALEPGSLSDG